MKIRTEATIAAAHLVHTTDTPCKRIHGHNWKVEVIVRGVIKEDGMVIDFIDIKKIINELDHKFLIPNTMDVRTPLECNGYIGLSEIFITKTNKVVAVMTTESIQLVDVPVITAEYLAVYIAKEIRKKTDINEVVEVTIWESDKSYASTV